MARTFKTDAKNILGLEASAAESVLLQIALQRPSDYFAMRANLTKALLEPIVELGYNLIWNALTTGTDAANAGRIMEYPQGVITAGIVSTKHHEPKLPENEINKRALEAAAGFKKVVEEIVEGLMPKKMFDLSTSRIVRKTELEMGT